MITLAMQATYAKTRKGGQVIALVSISTPGWLRYLWAQTRRASCTERRKMRVAIVLGQRDGVGKVDVS
ncbi:MAG TPA: hypothetical protein VNE42_07260 [Acidimicrobiales bacterium]|nr:hypothetical protein [Acidimicrobiales bacterium]